MPRRATTRRAPAPRPKPVRKAVKMPVAQVGRPGAYGGTSKPMPHAKGTSKKQSSYGYRT